MEILLELKHKAYPKFQIVLLLLLLLLLLLFVLFYEESYHYSIMLHAVRKKLCTGIQHITFHLGIVLLSLDHFVKTVKSYPLYEHLLCFHHY
jgi:hypothetical protein